MSERVTPLTSVLTHAWLRVGETLLLILECCSCHTPSLPQDTTLPASISLGTASVRGTLTGSHLAPTVSLTANLPEPRITASTSISNAAVCVEARGPMFGLDARIHTSLPTVQQFRASDTQAQAKLYSTPRFEGCDADVFLSGPDVLPLVSSTTVFDPLSASQPLRVRLNGRVKVSIGGVTTGVQGGGQGAAAAGTGAEVLFQGEAL